MLAGKRSTRRRKRPGPKPTITLAVVKRVSARVARGITLELALAMEKTAPVGLSAWQKAIQRHPNLALHYRAGQGHFLDSALKRLAEAKDLKFLCWLLERRHSDLFARPAAAEIRVNASATAVTGIPADLIERARSLALGEAGRNCPPIPRAGLDSFARVL